MKSCPDGMAHILKRTRVLQVPDAIVRLVAILMVHSASIPRAKERRCDHSLKAKRLLLAIARQSDLMIASWMYSRLQDASSNGVTITGQIASDPPQAADRVDALVAYNVSPDLCGIVRVHREPPVLGVMREAVHYGAPALILAW
jgi:hypothetical protein